MERYTIRASRVIFMGGFSPCFVVEDENGSRIGHAPTEAEACEIRDQRLAAEAALEAQLERAEREDG